MSGGGGDPRAAGAEWTAEIDLDEARVRAIVGGQFPEVSLDGLAPFAAGWDNALWATGEGTAFRFPRRSIAVPGVEREIAVLPMLAPRVPLPIPVPTLIGRPAEGYPWPFFGARLLPGTEIADAPLDGDREAFGLALAGFLQALHAPSILAAFGSGLARDPMGRADMTRRVPRTRERFATLESLGLWTASPAAFALLDEAETLPATTDEALVHGDLHVRHVLVGLGRATLGGHRLGRSRRRGPVRRPVALLEPARWAGAHSVPRCLRCRAAHGGAAAPGAGARAVPRRGARGVRPRHRQ